RRQFFRAVAMAARLAPIKKRRGLARAYAERRKSSRRQMQDRQFPAANATPRSRRPLLPALPRTTRQRAPIGRASLRRNVETRSARSSGGSERFAKPELFDSSAVALEV